MFSCVFCLKECKNDNSLRNHQRLCKLNPNKQTTIFHSIEFKQKNAKNNNRSNQYIKAKKEGTTYILSDDVRKIMKEKNVLRWDDEKRKKWSEFMKIQANKNVINHPESYSYKNFCGRSKKTLYNGEWMHSNWELEVAKWLDSKEITWTKKMQSFEYEWNGETRQYFPDFYLIEFNLYIEVKGYQTDRDIAKWKSVPNLIVLKDREIKKIRSDEFFIEPVTI